MFILGSCSAESREQVLLTARQIKEACVNTPFIFRAGAWKPRTSPDTFQGHGEKALEWLAEAKQTYCIDIATEVATPEHVSAALKAGIDYLWIGARTSANPIATQAIADALKNADCKGVLIKNPVSEDPALWIGNIERLEKTGLPIYAIHRGCNHQPCWSMAHTIRTARPDIPLLIDPSHMSGDAAKIQSLLSKAAELHYNGAMIEVHPNPAEALSDAKQQITPNQLPNFILPILDNTPTFNEVELEWLRAEIDELDDRLWATIAARMDVSERIGVWKKAHGVQPLQPQRFEQILAQRQKWAALNNLPPEFVQQLFHLIHRESLNRQQ